MKKFTEIKASLDEAVSMTLDEAANVNPAGAVKQLDRMGDQLDSMVKEFDRTIGKSLKRIGLDDSSKTSSTKVDGHIRNIKEAFENLSVSLSDLANDIDDYHG